MKSTLAILIVCIGVSSGLQLGGGSKSDLNSVRTTWGPNPLSSEYFVKQPLTVTEAKQNGFEQIPGKCEGKFVGQRFYKGKDVGLILIYDVQGSIAGTQMAIPASMVTEQYYKFSAQKMYNRDTINGVDVYILTAYFVDPKTICVSGRNASRLKQEGASTGLWLQNGTDPIRDSSQAPPNQVDNTRWIKGSCFPSMGVHYWYDNRLDADCDTFFPTFLLYHNGKLIGLGWVVFGKYDYTKRTEFPPLAAITSFLIPVPTCVAKRFTDAGGFTTMHVYLNAEPMLLNC